MPAEAAGAGAETSPAWMAAPEVPAPRASVTGSQGSGATDDNGARASGRQLVGVARVSAVWFRPAPGGARMVSHGGWAGTGAAASAGVGDREGPAGGTSGACRAGARDARD